MGRIVCEGLGIPPLPFVAIPHPLLGLSKDRVSELALNIIPEIVRILTTPADQLEDEFKGWYVTTDNIVITCDEVGCKPVYFPRRS